LIEAAQVDRLPAEVRLFVADNESPPAHARAPVPDHDGLVTLPTTSGAHGCLGTLHRMQDAMDAKMVEASLGPVIDLGGRE
jgi:hypothetical protein